MMHQLVFLNYPRQTLKFFLLVQRKKENAKSKGKQDQRVNRKNPVEKQNLQREVRQKIKKVQNLDNKLFLYILVYYL